MDIKSEEVVEVEYDDLVDKLDGVDKKINEIELSIKELKEKETGLISSIENLQNEETKKKKESVKKKELIKELKSENPEVEYRRRLVERFSYKNTELISKIYKENKEKAKIAHATLFCYNYKTEDNKLPLYNQPSDLKLFEENNKKFKLFRPRLIKFLQKKKIAENKMEVHLNNEYESNRKLWLRKVEKVDNNPKRKQRQQRIRQFYEREFPEIKKHREQQERFERLGSRSVGFIRSEAELDEIADNLREMDASEKQMRLLAINTPMLLSTYQRKSKFINNNGLINNIADYENHRKSLVVWNEQEKQTFREKFLQCPKDFEKISSFLSNKNCSDCVLYYYQNKKKEGFRSSKSKTKKKGKLNRGGTMSLRIDHNKQKQGKQSKENIGVDHYEEDAGNDSVSSEEETIPSNTVVSALITSHATSELHVTPSLQEIVESTTTSSSIATGETNKELNITNNAIITTCASGKTKQTPVKVFNTRSGKYNQRNNTIQAQGKLTEKSNDEVVPVISTTVVTTSSEATSHPPLKMTIMVTSPSHVKDNTNVTSVVSIISETITSSSMSAPEQVNSATIEPPKKIALAVNDSTKKQVLSTSDPPKKQTSSSEPPRKQSSTSTEHSNKLATTANELPKKLVSISNEPLRKTASTSCEASKKQTLALQEEESSNEALQKVDELIKLHLSKMPEHSDPSRWSEHEMMKAVEGLKKYGRSWPSISKLVETKSEAQCKNFYFNYKKKFNLESILGIAKREDHEECGTSATTVDHHNEVELVQYLEELERLDEEEVKRKKKQQAKVGSVIQKEGDSRHYAQRPYQEDDLCQTSNVIKPTTQEQHERDDIATSNILEAAKMASTDTWPIVSTPVKPIENQPCSPLGVLRPPPPLVSDPLINLQSPPVKEISLKSDFHLFKQKLKLSLDNDNTVLKPAPSLIPADSISADSLPVDSVQFSPDDPRHQLHPQSSSDKWSPSELHLMQHQQQNLPAQHSKYRSHSQSLSEQNAAIKAFSARRTGFMSSLPQNASPDLQSPRFRFPVSPSVSNKRSSQQSKKSAFVFSNPQSADPSPHLQLPHVQYPQQSLSPMQQHSASNMSGFNQRNVESPSLKQSIQSKYSIEELQNQRMEMEFFQRNQEEQEQHRRDFPSRKYEPKTPDLVLQREIEAEREAQMLQRQKELEIQRMHHEARRQEEMQNYMHYKLANRRFPQEHDDGQHILMRELEKQKEFGMVHPHQFFSDHQRGQAGLSGSLENLLAVHERKSAGSIPPHERASVGAPPHERSATEMSNDMILSLQRHFSPYEKMGQSDNLPSPVDMFPVRHRSNSDLQRELKQHSPRNDAYLRTYPHQLKPKSINELQKRAASIPDLRSDIARARSDPFYDLKMQKERPNQFMGAEQMILKQDNKRPVNPTKTFDYKFADFENSINIQEVPLEPLSRPSSAELEAINGPDKNMVYGISTGLVRKATPLKSITGSISALAAQRQEFTEQSYILPRSPAMSQHSYNSHTMSSKEGELLKPKRIVRPWEIPNPLSGRPEFTRQSLSSPTPGFSQMRQQQESGTGYPQMRQHQESNPGFSQMRQHQESSPGFPQMRQQQESIPGFPPMRQQQEQSAGFSQMRQQQEQSEGFPQLRQQQEPSPGFSQMRHQQLPSPGFSQMRQQQGKPPSRQGTPQPVIHLAPTTSKYKKEIISIAQMSSPAPESFPKFNFDADALKDQHVMSTTSSSSPFLRFQQQQHKQQQQQQQQQYSHSIIGNITPRKMRSYSEQSLSPTFPMPNKNTIIEKNMIPSRELLNRLRSDSEETISADEIENKETIIANINESTSSLLVKRLISKDNRQIDDKNIFIKKPFSEGFRSEHVGLRNEHAGLRNEQAGLQSEHAGLRTLTHSVHLSVDHPKNMIGTSSSSSKVKTVTVFPEQILASTTLSNAIEKNKLLVKETPLQNTESSNSNQIPRLTTFACNDVDSQFEQGLHANGIFDNPGSSSVLFTSNTICKQNPTSKPMSTNATLSTGAVNLLDGVSLVDKTLLDAHLINPEAFTTNTLITLTTTKPLITSTQSFTSKPITESSQPILAKPTNQPILAKPTVVSAQSVKPSVIEPFSCFKPSIACNNPSIATTQPVILKSLIRSSITSNSTLAPVQFPIVLPSIAALAQPIASTHKAALSHSKNLPPSISIMQLTINEKLTLSSIQPNTVEPSPYQQTIVVKSVIPSTKHLASKPLKVLTQPTVSNSSIAAKPAAINTSIVAKPAAVNPTISAKPTTIHTSIAAKPTAVNPSIYAKPTPVNHSISAKPTPVNPSISAKPTPVNPLISAKPTPVNPSISVKPTPVNPLISSKPTPVNPSISAKPTPVTPVNPSISAKPTPVNPLISAKPTPVNPLISAKPTPVNPSISAKPTPVNPSISAKPTPVNPLISAKPTPVNPSISAKPTPVNPLISAKPTPVNPLISARLITGNPSISAKQPVLAKSSIASIQPDTVKKSVPLDQKDYAAQPVEKITQLEQNQGESLTQLEERVSKEVKPHAQAKEVEPLAQPKEVTTPAQAKEVTPHAQTKEVKALEQPKEVKPHAQAKEVKALPEERPDSPDIYDDLKVHNYDDHTADDHTADGSFDLFNSTKDDSLSELTTGATSHITDIQLFYTDTSEVAATKSSEAATKSSETATKSSEAATKSSEVATKSTTNENEQDDIEISALNHTTPNSSEISSEISSSTNVSKLENSKDSEMRTKRRKDAGTPVMDEPASTYSNLPEVKTPLLDERRYEFNTAEQKSRKASHQETFESITPPSSPEHRTNYDERITLPLPVASSSSVAFPYSALAFNVNSRPGSRASSCHSEERSPRNDDEVRSKTDSKHEHQNLYVDTKRASKRRHHRSTSREYSSHASPSHFTKSPEFEYKNKKPFAWVSPRQSPRRGEDERKEKRKRSSSPDSGSPYSKHSRPTPY